MPKSIKGASTRTPPEPGTHAEIEAWIKRVMPDLNPIVTWLDAEISESIPDVEYALTVTDTRTWRKVRYENPLGRRSPAVTDSSAFDCP